MKLGKPRLFVEGPFLRVFNWAQDLHPDGRMLLVVGPEESFVDNLEVIAGLPALLGSIAPASR